MLKSVILLTEYATLILIVFLCKDSLVIIRTRISIYFRYVLKVPHLTGLIFVLRNKHFDFFNKNTKDFFYSGKDSLLTPVFQHSQWNLYNYMKPWAQARFLVPVILIKIITKITKISLYRSLIKRSPHPPVRIRVNTKNVYFC